MATKGGAHLELNRKTVRTILLIITFGVVLFIAAQNLASIYGAIRDIWNVFSVVTAGLALAFVLNVPLRLFEDKLFYGLREHRRALVRKLLRPLSLACAVLLALSIVVLLLVVVLPQLTRTVTEIADKLPDYIATAVDWVETTLRSLNLSTSSLPEIRVDWEAAFAQLSAYLRDGMGSIIGTATNVGTSVVSTLMNLVFSLIIAVYVLAQKERVGRFVRRCMAAFLPVRLAGRIRRMARMAAETFSNFISGQLTDSLILALLCYIGMHIFRFPYPAVIAIVIGVTSLIPIIGALVGEMIGAFLILFISPLKALLFLVFILCLQQVEGSFIYPRVVGKSVGLPGVLVLCAVIVGGNIAGVLGALLGVPVCAILYTLLREAMDARLSQRGKTPWYEV